MRNSRESLDNRLHEIVLGHLSKLADYIPGPMKKAGRKKEDLIRTYSDDPLFSIFGLDSLEYVNATLGGGTVTSIHRKLGDIYEQCVHEVFHNRLAISREDLVYRAKIMSGTTEETRTADVYIQFDKVTDRAVRDRIRKACKVELRKLADHPKLKLIGVGMEVRHCYRTNDSKRTQADEAMARHLLVSGILPLMPLFCNQSTPTIINRYRSVWVIKEGHESYNLVKEFSGFDLYAFMMRNRDEFRKPVIEMLRGLSE